MVHHISVLKRRDSLKEQIDKATHTAGINILDKYSLFDLYKVIGPNYLAIIYKIIEDYILLLDYAIFTLNEIMNELASVSKKIYLDLDIGKLSFEVPEDKKFILEKTMQPFFKN